MNALILQYAWKIYVHQTSYRCTCASDKSLSYIVVLMFDSTRPTAWEQNLYCSLYEVATLWIQGIIPVIHVDNVYQRFAIKEIAKWFLSVHIKSADTNIKLPRRRVFESVLNTRFSRFPRSSVHLCTNRERQRKRERSRRREPQEREMRCCSVSEHSWKRTLDCNAHSQDRKRTGEPAS